VLLATLAACRQSQCGSCWAHAATESIETHVAIATGNLWVLSQQQISSCTPNPQQCGGTLCTARVMCADLRGEKSVEEFGSAPARFLGYCTAVCRLA
jgi:hypothetical protein